MPLPAAPPGLRSRLDPAAGGGPAAPSTNELDASPQLSESMTVPPRVRRTRLPPVEAKPPEYSPSAPLAHLPAEFASSKRRCAGSVRDVQVCLRVTVEPLDVT